MEIVIHPPNVRYVYKIIKKHKKLLVPVFVFSYFFDFGICLIHLHAHGKEKH